MLTISYKKRRLMGSTPFFNQLNYLKDITVFNHNRNQTVIKIFNM